MLTNLLIVAKANELIGEAHGQAYRAIRPYLRDGLFDLEQSNVHDQIVAVRFLKKFQEPSANGTRERKQTCIDKWLATEAEGEAIRFDSIPLHLKGDLYRARALLSDWLSEFRRGGDIEFTPGESYESHRGRTSVYHKLRFRSHWTCTYDAFDDFAHLVYNTTGLKRAAHRLMKPITRRESIQLLSEHESAYGVFKYRLEKDVVIFTHGSRLSTVPKNNETDRAINIETTANMLLQRTVAQPLRRRLAELGNDLGSGQDVHRARISDENQATIDFSEASDRIWMDIVSHMFPASVLKYLKRYRSEMVLVDDSYYWVNKLSSMGCGFTFEVMTMLLLSVARVLDPAATVYGDDVIINNQSAARFCELCTAIGMKVNAAKSFISAPLRESCGSYHVTGYGYVECFDFHWCESWNDVTISCNKLHKIISELPSLSEIRVILSDLHCKLLRLVPAFAKGPVTNELGCGFVHDPAFMKSQKKCNVSRRLYNDVKVQILPYLEALQYDLHFGVCKIQLSHTPDAFSRHNRSFRDMGPRFLASLLAGRYAPVTSRGTDFVSEKLMVVHPDMGCLLLSELIRIQGNLVQNQNKNNLRVAG